MVASGICKICKKRQPLYQLNKEEICRQCKEEIDDGEHLYLLRQRTERE